MKSTIIFTQTGIRYDAVEIRDGEEFLREDMDYQTVLACLRGNFPHVTKITVEIDHK